MQEVARGGRTVVFISHNLMATERLCTQGFLFDGGRLVADGPMPDVAARYQTADRISTCSDDRLVPA